MHRFSMIALPQRSHTKVVCLMVSVSVGVSTATRPVGDLSGRIADVGPFGQLDDEAPVLSPYLRAGMLQTEVTIVLDAGELHRTIESSQECRVVVHFDHSVRVCVVKPATLENCQTTLRGEHMKLIRERC
jgi:hypothetical protein